MIEIFRIEKQNFLKNATNAKRFKLGTGRVLDRSNPRTRLKDKDEKSEPKGKRKQRVRVRISVGQGIERKKNGIPSVGVMVGWYLGKEGFEEESEEFKTPHPTPPRQTKTQPK